jgi:hypothetical protein
MGEPEERRTALLNLMNLGEPVDAALRSLAKYRWGETVAIQVDRSHVVRLLEAFVAGRVTNDEVERWAFALAGRDDVDYEPHMSAEIAQFMFEAENPEINGVLTVDRASEWIRRLGPTTT